MPCRSTKPCVSLKVVSLELPLVGLLSLERVMTLNEKLLLHPVHQNRWEAKLLPLPRVFDHSTQKSQKGKFAVHREARASLLLLLLHVGRGVRLGPPWRS